MSTTPIQSGRRYRRAINGLFAVGIVAFLVGMLVEQSLAGLTVYVVAVAAGIALTLLGTLRESVLMHDERDYELSRRASDLTFRLFGYAGLFGFVALIALDLTGRRPMTPIEDALLITYAAVTLTWGAIYVALKYRP